MKKLIIVFLILSPSFLFSQKEAAHWYFGRGAGLNFNTTPPTVLTNGKLHTFEGCATISNKKGELLFYTDGTTVYNKNHIEMPNGTDLYGDSSSTQSAIIVPMPQNENIYYIFTVRGNGATGLTFSTVDMSLDNGNGDIILDEKNIELLSNSSEKITAVKHLDGSSVWVIAFDGGSFHSFKVSTSGVNKKAVKSLLGDAVETRGYLKASPNGEFLAMANHNSPSYLLSFFSGNGKVFPGIKLEFISENEKGYGVEFSPNSQKLYVDTFTEQLTDSGEDDFTRYLYQYDINAQNLIESRKLIDTRKNTYRGALQLGIDLKIYRALSTGYETGSEYLGVIHDPNINGALCNYSHNAVNLNSGFRTTLSTQGLPPFNQSLFFFTINISNACSNELAQFSLTTTEENYTVNWDFGDNTTSTDITPSHQYSTSGAYQVIANMILSNGESKEIKKTIRIFDVPQLIPNQYLIQCDNDSNGIGNFNLNEAKNLISKENYEYYDFEFYASLNNFNDDIPIDTPNSYVNTLSTPQEIWVKVINEIGCEATTNLYIEAVNTKLGPLAPFVVCDDSDLITDNQSGMFDLNINETEIRTQFNLTPSISIRYYPTELDAELETNEIEKTEIISKSKSIWIRAESDRQACIGIEELLLIVNTLPNPSISSNYFLCINKNNDFISINASDLYDSYQWRNEDTNELFSTNQSVEIYNTGTYSLTSSVNKNNIECYRREVFSINPANSATIESINIKDNSINNTISIITSGEGLYQYSLFTEQNEIYIPYQDDNTFQNVRPGIYNVQVNDIKNNCGLTTEQISVIGFPKYFTPNFDGVNDTWQIYGVSKNFYPNTQILIFDRYGKLIKQLSPLSKGWDGKYNGHMLPTDDYWFSVKLQDGRTFKNHFTLKL